MVNCKETAGRGFCLPRVLPYIRVQHLSRRVGTLWTQESPRVDLNARQISHEALDIVRRNLNETRQALLVSYTLSTMPNRVL